MMRDQRESKINLSEALLPEVIADGALVDPTLGGDNYIFKPTDSMQFWLVDAMQSLCQSNRVGSARKKLPKARNSYRSIESFSEENRYSRCTMGWAMVCKSVLPAATSQSPPSTPPVRTADHGTTTSICRDAPASRKAIQIYSIRPSCKSNKAS
jgi:hypothetical protein